MSKETTEEALAWAEKRRNDVREWGITRQVPCPKCNAGIGEDCHSEPLYHIQPAGHAERRRLARQKGDRYVPVTVDEVAENIAIGVHTGLRKGSEAPSSATLWRAISDSDDGAWSDAAEYAAWCMDYMGWRVTKPERIEE